MVYNELLSKETINEFNKVISKNSSKYLNLLDSGQKLMFIKTLKAESGGYGLKECKWFLDGVVEGSIKMKTIKDERTKKLNVLEHNDKCDELIYKIRKLTNKKLKEVLMGLEPEIVKSILLNIK